VDSCQPPTLTVQKCSPSFQDTYPPICPENVGTISPSNCYSENRQTNEKPALIRAGFLFLPSSSDPAQARSHGFALENLTSAAVPITVASITNTAEYEKDGRVCYKHGQVQDAKGRFQVPSFQEDSVLSSLQTNASRQESITCSKALGIARRASLTASQPTGS
jgi:hypothetical protein